MYGPSSFCSSYPLISFPLVDLHRDPFDYGKLRCLFLFSHFSLVRRGNLQDLKSSLRGGFNKTGLNQRDEVSHCHQPYLL